MISLSILSVYLLGSVVSAASVQYGSPASTAKGALPTVDLGYSLHRAALFNETGQFYNFSNIRYAAPPTGDLLWRPPQKPAADRSKVQDGSVGHICPQANPVWGAEFIQPYLAQKLAGKTPNLTQSDLTGFNDSISLTNLPPKDPREDLDCLFLDVIVPKKTMDQAKKGSGTPVLVWIFGGGYTANDKTSLNPAGLVDRGIANGKEYIFVAMNYRLGAFGWLAGPTLQSDGTANAGLYDQRLALEWIQKHIKSFGGDPKRVTLMGESAGKFVSLFAETSTSSLS